MILATLSMMGSTDDRLHQLHLRRAAMLALRGHGGAEPNPMVGCVIIDSRGRTVGWGYHRHVGGPHAEIVAIQRAGQQARGATLYCTLEPCNHHGRTGPCSRAVIDAGIARVIVAQRDPWHPASGGLDQIAAAGIETRVVASCFLASMVGQPFAHRVLTGLPWVTVKWAQTVDGRIATANGQSRWISSESSRRMVHRERGRVDAILTGIGTVLQDDPLLTPRDVRVRRVLHRPEHGGRPLRVVIDPLLQTPITSKIVQTAALTPVLVACSNDHATASDGRAERLRASGVTVLGVHMEGTELPLEPVLRHLVMQHDVTHVMVEAGTGLMSRLFRRRLVNEAWVFTAPLILGDTHAIPAVAGMSVTSLTDGIHMRPWCTRTRDGDLITRYLVTADHSP